MLGRNKTSIKGRNRVAETSDVRDDSPIILPQRRNAAICRTFLLKAKKIGGGLFSLFNPSYSRSHLSITGCLKIEPGQLRKGGPVRAQARQTAEINLRFQMVR